MWLVSGGRYRAYPAKRSTPPSGRTGDLPRKFLALVSTSRLAQEKRLEAPDSAAYRCVFGAASEPVVLFARPLRNGARETRPVRTDGRVIRCLGMADDVPLLPGKRFLRCPPTGKDSYRCGSDVHEGRIVGDRWESIPDRRVYGRGPRISGGPATKGWRVFMPTATAKKRIVRNARNHAISWKSCDAATKSVSYSAIDVESTSRAFENRRHGRCHPLSMISFGNAKRRRSTMITGGSASSRRAFGHRCYYLVCEDGDGVTVGVLPLVHLKSRFFGNFLVSMPYFNYGGVARSNRPCALF